MTVISNKQSENKFFKWIKVLWREDRFPLFMFIFLIVGGSIGGYMDYTLKEEKINYLTKNKPLLVCVTMIICGSDRYKNYNIVDIDGDIKIEILDDKNQFKEYIDLNHIEYVKKIN